VLRSYEITLIPTFGKYLGAILLEELFVEFNAIVMGLVEVLGTVELHPVTPTQFVRILVLEVDGDPVVF
jgi:hypothetical protein